MASGAIGWTLQERKEERHCGAGMEEFSRIPAIDPNFDSSWRNMPFHVLSVMQRSEGCLLHLMAFSYTNQCPASG